MAGLNHPWAKPLLLGELPRGVTSLRLEPDAAQRAAIAAKLGLLGLPALTAQLQVKPWMDGVEVAGRVEAVVEQTCSVSLEPFEQPLSGEIEVRAVPAGSPHAPTTDGGEVELNPDTPDPPDILESDTLDLAAYVVEHLALEIDPFPRKPGVVFDYSPPTEETSPFAALKGLKTQDDPQ